MSWYSGTRVEDLPEPTVPCFKMKCEDCAKEVWVDARAQKFVKTHPVLCEKCTAKEARASERWEPTKDFRIDRDTN